MGIKKKINNFTTWLYRWMNQIIDPLKLSRSVPNYLRFLSHWRKYKKLPGSEPIRIGDTYPSIHDWTSTTAFDVHYFYQNIWAFKRINASKPKEHVDVGSKIDFVVYLTGITQVIFTDIRPFLINVDNYKSKKGDLLNLPYKNNSIKSLSCLHVAEHVGLGRYGDSLDPLGTKKAASELSRVLSEGGNLFFSLPIGRPRLCFNSHRIHSVKQILNYFPEMELIELSGITDDGKFMENIETEKLDSSEFGCGLFWFKKRNLQS